MLVPLAACPAPAPRRSAAGRPARLVARLVPLLSPPGALERVNGEAAGLAAPLLGFDVISAFSGVRANVFCIYNVMFTYKIFYFPGCYTDSLLFLEFSDYLK